MDFQLLYDCWNFFKKFEVIFYIWTLFYEYESSFQFECFFPILYVYWKRLADYLIIDVSWFFNFYFFVIAQCFDIVHSWKIMSNNIYQYNIFRVQTVLNLENKQKGHEIRWGAMFSKEQIILNHLFQVLRFWFNPNLIFFSALVYRFFNLRLEPNQRL